MLRRNTPEVFAAYCTLDRHHRVNLLRVRRWRFCSGCWRTWPCQKRNNATCYLAARGLSWTEK